MRVALFFVGVALFAVAGCAPSAETLIEQELAIVRDATATLETITDAETAQAAAPKLAGLQEQLKDLLPQMKKLGLSTDERRAVESDYEEQMQSAAQAFLTEAERVRKLGLRTAGLSDLNEILPSL